MQIKSNCKALAKRLVELGYTLVSNGTDNHLVLVGLRPLGIDGARAEKVLDIASIILNKNSVPGDKSAMVPGGIRIGTPTLTTRGFDESDFVSVAEFIHEGVQIAIKAKKMVQDAKLKTYLEFIDSEASPFKAEIKDLMQRVEGFATKFPLLGVGTEALV